MEEGEQLGHVDGMLREALQQAADEGGKQLVTTQEVSGTTGAEREAWKLAAEAELANFAARGAFHVTTSEERAKCQPLPMTCAWTQDGPKRKCRACVCGNFTDPDPAMRAWTAQAEPSSLLASLKVGCREGWTKSKHDVKGAFLYAEIPDGKVVVVV